MPSPFEAEIGILMRDLGDVSLVADDLLRRWKMNVLDEREQQECAFFLIHSGLHARLMKVAYRLVPQNTKLPWAALCEGIGELRLSLSETEAMSIVDGARAQNAELEIAHSRKLELQQPIFKEIRARFLSERAMQVETRRKELKDKIQYMRVGRMYSQEEKLLKEIQAIFPEEKEYAQERDDLELRWAREVIAKSANPGTMPTSDLRWRIDKLTPEQTSAKSLIVERAKQAALSLPKMAYELALSLHFMDFNSEALEILDAAQPRPEAPIAGPSLEIDWLRLELMLQARQYVNALDEAGRLELAYAGEPDSAFAVVYARARALRGLGQDTMAIDLLRSLVKIRPHYKSAYSLLLEWSGGDE
jgi:hypothetical protein